MKHLFYTIYALPYSFKVWRVLNKVLTCAKLTLIKQQVTPDKGDTLSVSDLFSLNKASKQTQGSTLEKILLRSNNVIASLKALVANNQIAEAGLHEMLMRSKNLENTNRPTGDVHKLDRTGRWWFNANTLECGPEEYDAFIATEAILNISQDVEALKNTHASETELQLVRTTLSQVANLLP